MPGMTQSGIAAQKSAGPRAPRRKLYGFIVDNESRREPTQSRGRVRRAIHNAERRNLFALMPQNHGDTA